MAGGSVVSLGPMGIDYLGCYNSVSDQNVKYLIVVVICSWLAFLVHLLATTSSEYFSPTLASISLKGKIGSNLAGVTLLAFANGAPDVFSSISGLLNTNSADISIGELFGGALFISTMVISAVAILSPAPIKLCWLDFTRDLLFLIVAVSSLAYAGLVVHTMTLTTVAWLLSVYLVYIGSVLLSPWWLRKVCGRRSGEEDESGGGERGGGLSPQSRNPLHERLQTAFWFQDHLISSSSNSLNSTDGASVATSDKCNASTSTSVKTNVGGESTSSRPTTAAAEYKFLILDDPDFERELMQFSTDRAAGATGALASAGAGATTTAGNASREINLSGLSEAFPSLIIEDYIHPHPATAATTTAAISGNNSSINNNNNISNSGSSTANNNAAAINRPLLGPSSQRTPSPTINSTPAPTSTPTPTPTPALPHPLPHLLPLSSTPLPPRKAGRFEISTKWALENSNSPLAEVLLRDSRTDLENEGKVEGYAEERGGSGSGSGSERGSGRGSGGSGGGGGYHALIYSPAGEDSESTTGRTAPHPQHQHHHNHNGQTTWSATNTHTHHHRHNNHHHHHRHNGNGRFLGYLRQLIMRRRHLTAPGRPPTLPERLLSWCEYPFTLARDVTIPTVDPLLWYKPYAVMQPLLAPLFLLGMTGNIHDVVIKGSSFPLAAGFLLAGILPSLWVFLFTHHSKPPPVLLAPETDHQALMSMTLSMPMPMAVGFYHYFVVVWLLLAFFICIAWIYLFATEIVCCLTAVGTMLNIPSYFLGLTVLAWGNSASDLFANLSVARRGLGEMAVAGCYGGPVFNILVGIAASLGCVCVRQYPTPFDLTLDTSAVVSVGFLYLSLATTLFIVAVPCGFTLRPILGYYLIALYSVYTVVQTVLVCQ